jgi:hypothetical protein
MVVCLLFAADAELERIEKGVLGVPARSHALPGPEDGLVLVLARSKSSAVGRLDLASVVLKCIKLVLSFIHASIL